ncbi:TetR/AcrR family transcriptional regulator [Paenibacillus sp. NPDC058174]|uniref:TetR/AcrR family transcriptional regulator n=1 Tax=Paenibacillus sp. NPDC058174 TaxID=3346366 RepID=UPI0036DDB98B
MNKNTEEVILDTAQSIVQEFGFNGFSYAHIAKKVGIRTSSIHYYFPNKEDLGEALIERYYNNFLASIAQIDAEINDNIEKLQKFIQLYSGPVKEYCTCMGVMLATDLASLSGQTLDGIAKLFTSNLDWLRRVLDEGRSEGQLNFTGSSETVAHQFLASLQGAQLLARSFRDQNRFNLIAEGLIAALI